MTSTRASPKATFGKKKKDLTDGSITLVAMDFALNSSNRAIVAGASHVLRT